MYDFENFAISSTEVILGGISGTCTGSDISSSGTTYVDIEWEDGTQTCHDPHSTGDGSSDDLVGGSVDWPCE